MIARDTLRTDDESLPKAFRKSERATELGLSPSGINRLLSSLTPSGRKDRSSGSDAEEGYGLIETDDWLAGRGKETFVLTAAGRECVTQLIKALHGKLVEPKFHDLDSLFKRLVDQRAKRKKR